MLNNIRGQVFLYGNQQLQEKNFGDFFAGQSLKMFGSDNLYQIIRYAKEISPDIMVFHLTDEKFHPIEHFSNEINETPYPIIVIQSNNKMFYKHPSVAHYLRIPQDLEKLSDIAESYSLGHKNHQILLLDTFSEKFDTLHKYISQNNYSFFEVHNTKAAELYLQKNTPKVVCVEYTPQFIAARHKLTHERIFYVDRTQDITEIKKFLN